MWASARPPRRERHILSRRRLKKWAESFVLILKNHRRSSESLSKKCPRGGRLGGARPAGADAGRSSMPGGGNTPMMFHFLGVPSESEFCVFIKPVPYYLCKHSEMDGADRGRRRRTSFVPVEMTSSRGI